MDLVIFFLLCPPCITWQLPGQGVTCARLGNPETVSFHFSDSHRPFITAAAAGDLWRGCRLVAEPRVVVGWSVTSMEIPGIK